MSQPKSPRRPRTLLEGIEAATAAPRPLNGATVQRPHPLVVTGTIADTLRAWHLKPQRDARLAGLDHWRAAAALSMTEDRGTRTLASAVRRLIDTYRLPYAYHTHRSDRSDAGFPDYVLVGTAGRGTLYAEIKKEGGKFSADQINCLTRLHEAGENVTWWSPADLYTGRIELAIAALAGLRGDQKGNTGARTANTPR